MYTGRDSTTIVSYTSESIDVLVLLSPKSCDTKISMHLVTSVKTNEANARTNSRTQTDCSCRKRDLGLYDGPP